MRFPLVLCALTGAIGCAAAAPVASVPAPVAAAELAGRGDQAAGALMAQAGSARQVESAQVNGPAVSGTGFGSGGPDADAATAPASIALTTPAGPTWDIPVAPYETHERVEHYVRRYTGPARGWFTERLERGTRYEGMIRGKLAAAGLPEDAYYLALVESGFDNHAYSSAAAVGIWQFMAATAKGMGLRVDWWSDERRDPVRATDAAVRFLASLNDQYGSVYLAAAAYNGGPTRVSRGLRRFSAEMKGAKGEDRYFALSAQDFLPRETREYVPQLIAAALVGNDHARHGIDVVSREAFAYDSVMVPALTSLPAIARAAGTDVSTIADLNPQFLRGMTPPRAASRVRVPVGARARFTSAFALMPDSVRAGVRRERVTTAGSLATVARSFGTTSKGVTAFNPNLKRTKNRNIAAGQTLFIPRADVAAAALDVSDPSEEGYGSVPRARMRFHTVASGETLGHLALRYDTSVSALMRLNRLKKPLIRIGQELAVGTRN